MSEVGVGRVLVASLHQGIGDVLPARLGFYESWLTHEGLREGTIGLAPLFAVLSFLRQEGEAYGTITTRAGEYAAEWTVLSLPTWKRSLIQMAPTRMRRRLVFDLAASIVRQSYQGSRAVSRHRAGTARLDVRGSIFCNVRQKVGYPLCGFYAAALTRLLSLFDLRGHAEVVTCRGTGESSCTLHVAMMAVEAAHDGSRTMDATPSDASLHTDAPVLRVGWRRRVSDGLHTLKEYRLTPWPTAVFRPRERSGRS
jgi:hypothetical protein